MGNEHRHACTVNQSWNVYATTYVQLPMCSANGWGVGEAASTFETLWNCVDSFQYHPPH